MKLALPLNCFAMLMIMACGNPSDPNAKGGVWDETENGVAILVIDPQGNPVPNARVRIVPEQTWARDILSDRNPVADSALTDSHGQALVHTSSWPSNLEVESTLGMIRESLSSPDSARRVTPKSPGTLDGVLLAESKPWPDSMHIAGSSFVAKVQSDGSFHFAKLPTSDYMLLSVIADKLHIVATTNLDTSANLLMDSLRIEDKDSVLLDDFEDQIDANRFHALSGSGWWYMSSDSNSQIIPSNPRAAFVASTESFQQGQSFHVRFAIDSSVAGKFALCGFDLGESRLTHPSTASYDLSGVDSISFWAKGKGSMQLQMNGLLPLTSQIAQISVAFSLDSIWTRHVIRPAQMKPLRGTTTWQELAPYTNSFNWMSTGEADFWLDQIQLHGISDSELYSTLLRK